MWLDTIAAWLKRYYWPIAIVLLLVALFVPKGQYLAGIPLLIVGLVLFASYSTVRNFRAGLRGE